MAPGTSTMYRDSQGRDWPAIVAADHGNNEHSVIVFYEGMVTPFGPSINGQWTQNAAPVPAVTPLVNGSILG